MYGINLLYNIDIMTRLIAFLCFAMAMLPAQAGKRLSLESPDGTLQVTVTVDECLTYNVCRDGQTVLADSPLSMTLEDGTVVGDRPRLAGTSRRSVSGRVPSPFYRATDIEERYNELTLRLKGGWSVEFRAYDDGVAYRWTSKVKKPYRVWTEQVDYRFPSDVQAIVPYVRNGGESGYEPQFFNSFENTYTEAPLSQLDGQRLMFLPLSVQLPGGTRVSITEAALEDYPGLYLNRSEKTNSLVGVFAPYPKRLKQGGHNNLQMLVEEREGYIARVDGPRAFPWRIAIVTMDDKDLAASNLSYLLAEPSRLDDTSWIKPGKVAWEWWNDWNLDGVDFQAGVNNDTYEAYIDFASEHGIEYVILDEGWAVNLKADLMQVVPSLDLPALVRYAASKHVGIILWAGYHAFARDMEQVCSHYAAMGVKGFKVDFMDRDDQQMTDFCRRAAETCAKYRLVLDLHGMYKPAGMNRTYPNVLNFEGVNGLEQLKWSPASHDQVEYDVQIPFLRQVAGPMDYTQGAMRNASKGNYFPCNSEPMSQGTRCRQLALYVVFDSPLNMLCDSPSNYMREPESLDFIASIPTVWDETLVLQGKMGEYIVTARRKGDVWYVGGITDWTARDIELDCSFLGNRTYRATLFRDGANAHRAGRDYKRETLQLDRDSKLKLHLTPGGGFALKLE